jgi:hypothetical protein
MDLALEIKVATRSRAAAGFLLVAGLALPQTRNLLEQSLVGHMLIQLPLLCAAGWWGSVALGKRLAGLSDFAPAFVLTALFATIFWMLPRWLDAALTEPLVEALKFVTVPLFVGAPLGLAWAQLGTVVRGFIWANAISMLMILGWLYLAAPARVCNNYLLEQQETFGWAALAAALGISLYWTLLALFGSWNR